MRALIRRAQRGDGEAFIQLMEQQKEMMKRVAFGFFRNEEDAADAIQETMLNAFEHLGDLRKPEYFRTWLIRILLNNCTRIYNSNKKYVSGEGDLWEKESISDGTVEFLELLYSIPEDSRIFFQLYYGEKFTTREIARSLGMKENTVKSKLLRGRKQLERELKKA